MHRSALVGPLLLAVFVFGAACAGTSIPPLTPPELGGPPWVELTSAHFVVKTDLAIDRALELTTEFERAYNLFEDVAFPYEPKPTGRTQVLVLRSKDEYETFYGGGTNGFFVQRTSDPSSPALVMYGEMSEFTRNVLQHELAHRFVSFYFPGAPSWLHEGVAQYYSTLTVEEERVVLGRELAYLHLRHGTAWEFTASPIWGRIVWVPSDVLPTTEQLVEGTSEAYLKDKEGSGTIFYAASWALVHVLRNGDERLARRFDRFLVKLSEGVEASEAWRLAFHDVSFAELDESLRAFILRRETTVLRGAYEARRVAPAKARLLRPTEVRLLWVAARPWYKGQVDAVHRDLDAAFELSRGSAEVHLWRARVFRFEGRLAEAEAEISAGLRETPGDEALLLERLRVREEPGAVKDSAALDAVVRELLPRATSARSLNELAWYLARHDRADEALPLAVASVKADPNCAACHDTLALALFEVGRVIEAYHVQLIAVGLSTHGRVDPDMRSRLERFRAAAQTAAPASSRP